MEEADPNKDEVFVSGLPLDITEKEIAEYFGQIGIIKEVSNIV
jgi:RNA recognition motif-containing protein